MNIVSIQKSSDPNDYIEPRIAFAEATLLNASEKRNGVVSLAVRAALATVYEATDADGDVKIIPTAGFNFNHGTHILTSPWVAKGAAEYPIVVSDGNVTCPSLGADLVGLSAILDAFFARHTDEIIAAYNNIPDFVVNMHISNFYSL